MHIGRGPPQNRTRIALLTDVASRFDLIIALGVIAAHSEESQCFDATNTRRNAISNIANARGVADDDGLHIMSMAI